MQVTVFLKFVVLLGNALRFRQVHLNLHRRNEKLISFVSDYVKLIRIMHKECHVINRLLMLLHKVHEDNRHYYRGLYDDNRKSLV